jgi:hypothetical protein
VGDGCAEQSHDRIADVLVHGAAILRNDGIGPGVKSLYQPAEILGIEPGGKCSEAAQVGKENRYLSALTSRFGTGRGRRRTISGTAGRVGAPSAAATKGLAWRIRKAAIRANPAKRSATLRAELATLAILKITLPASHRQTPR